MEWWLILVLVFLYIWTLAVIRGILKDWMQLHYHHRSPQVVDRQVYPPEYQQSPLTPAN